MAATGGRVRWGTAAALAFAVILLSRLSTFDPVPLVFLPLGVVLLAIPFAPRWRWMALGALVVLFGASFSASPLGELSLGWATLLGGSYLFITLWRPRWGVLPRALLALAGALLAALVWVAVNPGWGNLDLRIRETLVSGLVALAGPAAGPAWATLPVAAMRDVALLWWRVFPAALCLQSLAALGLASWAVTRLRRGDGGPFMLRPLQDFRFNDQLVWIFILGLLLIVLPSGALTARLGWNALVFMAGLYALRGLGVFLFLIGGTPSFVAAAFGVLAVLVLYPLVLTTAVLVGLGDTWLDVRTRVGLPPRT